MVSSKDVSPQQCFLQVMQNKIELPNLLFDMCKTCERRRNLYYIFWVFCYILLREHLHFSYCKFVFKLYTAIAVLVGLDGDLARATCEVRSGTNRLAIHCNFRGCVTGQTIALFFPRSSLGRCGRIGRVCLYNLGGKILQIRHNPGEHFFWVRSCGGRQIRLIPGEHCFWVRSWRGRRGNDQGLKYAFGII
jgi:hypothetical protein